MISQDEEKIAILHPVSLSWNMQTNILQDNFYKVKDYCKGLIHYFNVGDILKHDNIYNMFVKENNQFSSNYLDSVKECLMKVKKSVEISNIQTLILPKDGWDCELKEVEKIIKSILPDIEIQIK